MICRLRQKKFLIFFSLGLVYFGLLTFSVLNYCGRCQISMPAPYHLHLGPSSFDNIHHSSSACIVDIESLGPVYVDILSAPPFHTTEHDNPAVKEGGAWKPSGCRSLQKVAVIIPYRDRETHLKVLLSRLHPMLQKQQIHYRIFIIEQFGTDFYNKGKIMNIGFEWAMQLDTFDCLVFHDVDLIPENEQNMYMCDEQFRHLSPAVDEMRYHVMYYNLAGGVIALTPDNFRKINGFSNVYWGWGNEDDDLSARSAEAGLLLTRPPDHIGRYKMIPHLKSNRAAQAYGLFWSWRERWAKDGLNNLVTMNHTVVSQTDAGLYTNITVNIGPSKGHILDGNRIEQQESIWWFLQFYFP